MNRRHVVLAMLLIMALALPVLGSSPWQAPTLDTVRDALSGLGFDDFIDESYSLYLLRFPQSITSAGLAAEYGIRNNALNVYSETFTEETFSIERLILDRLLEFSPESLSAEQQITYQIAEWYWDDLVRSQQYDALWLPLHFMGTRSLHGYTEFSLTESHPFEELQDVEDYIDRLNDIEVQFDQIIAQVERRRRLGIIPPRKTLEWAIPSIRTSMNAHYSMHPLFVALEEKTALISDGSEEQIEELLAAAASAIEEVVKPAYRKLYYEITSLLRDAPLEISLSRYDGGLEAYAHDLRHYTQTERTAAEIHELGIKEVARVQDELHQLAGSIGLDESVSIADIFTYAVQTGGTVGGREAISVTEAMIAEAKELVLSSGALRNLPEADFVVLADTGGGGFYMPGSMDGSRPGAYYVSGGTPMERYRMASVAFHETIPGHHVQISIAQELELPLLRQDITFTGFTEGWALYSERLMYELGIYDEDPLGNVGRLKYELLRAVRLVVDTGIHALGWSFEETVAYLMENLGDSRGTAEYRTLRYTVIPGQATAYMTGMLELLELRAAAQIALGDAFSLADFHDIVLGNGNVPLTFVRQLVDAWIAQ